MRPPIENMLSYEDISFDLLATSAPTKKADSSLRPE